MDSNESKLFAFTAFEDNQLTAAYPFTYVPTLGSSSSAENKNMMSEIWTNGDTII